MQTGGARGSGEHRLVRISTPTDELFRSRRRSLFRQEIFDITVAHRETVVEPNGWLDNIRVKAVTPIRDFLDRGNLSSNYSRPRVDLTGPCAAVEAVSSRLEPRRSAHGFHTPYRTRLRYLRVAKRAEYLCFWGLETGWWCRESRANRSPAFSLLNREITGNFREYGLQIANPHSLSHWILGLFREIP